MCMLDDSDPWDFFHDETRRAAKPYRCCECNRWIGKGERHRYATGLFDRNWIAYRMCAQCDEATRWLMAVCNGYMFETVDEDLGMHIRGQEEGYLSSSHLVRLVRWMRDDWKDRDGTLRSVDQVKAVTDSAIAAYQSRYAVAVAS